MSESYLTVKEVQDTLRISKNNVYKLINKEDFPKIKIGKAIRIPQSKFIEYMNANEGKKIEI